MRELIARLQAATGLTITALILEGFLLLAGELGLQLRPPADDLTPHTGELATALFEERPLRLKPDAGDARAAEPATEEAPASPPEGTPDAQAAPQSAPPKPSQAEAAAALWARLEKPLRTHVGPHDYELWLAPLVPLKATRKGLVLEVANDFVKSELQERFVDVIREEARALIGHHVWISFELKRSVKEAEAKRPEPEQQPKQQPEKEVTLNDLVEEELARKRRLAGRELSPKIQNVAHMVALARYTQLQDEKVKKAKEGRAARLSAYEAQPRQHAKPKGRSGEGG